jgi:hypothetical protein
VTVEALFEALSRPGVLDPKRQSLVGVLSTDVLVHTWDLAKAIGTEVTLNSRLCQIGLDRAITHKEQFEGTDMFAPPVPVAENAIPGQALGILRPRPQLVTAGVVPLSQVRLQSRSEPGFELS